MANKLLGQHFLKDRATAQKMIRAIAPARGEAIIEVGAGHGELTLPLAAACERSGSELIAVEKDVRLAEQLEKKLRGAGFAQVRVVAGDALALLGGPEQLIRRQPYKLVGNIPYYLTGRLLRVIGECDRPPERCAFMVQKEVAERLTARPPRTNRLAASVQFWGTPSVVASVAKGHFRPVPKVDSAIIAIAASEEKRFVAANKYYAAVRLIFAQPRKTVLNNLAAAFRGAKAKSDAKCVLKAIGIAPGTRPQNLSGEDIAAIIAALRDAPHVDNGKS